MSPRADIAPTPTDEEAAAIAAALQAVTAGGGDAAPDAAARTAITNARRWRFSGRWWRQPLPLRRERPRI